jgi:hypothetical protein
MSTCLSVSKLVDRLPEDHKREVHFSFGALRWISVALGVALKSSGPNRNSESGEPYLRTGSKNILAGLTI